MTLPSKISNAVSNFYRFRRYIDGFSARPSAHGERFAKEIKWPKDRPTGAPLILCLNRAGLKADLQQLRQSDMLSYAEVSAAALRRMQERWVPPSQRIQTYFNGIFRSEPNIRAPLLDFARAFLRAACKEAPLSAVLAANVDYWQDEAIKLACDELNLPFLVLSRENYVTEMSAEVTRNRFIDSKFIYSGSAVAVGSLLTRNMLLSTGGFDSTDILATGWPRYDSWVNKPLRPRTSRRLITLFSYNSPVYMAPNNFKSVLETFVNCAKASKSDVEFVLKLKKKADLAEHYQLYPELKNAPVRINYDQGAGAILEESRLIIGYNTSPMLEGLLADCAIAVPWWADSESNPYVPIIHPRYGDDEKYFIFPRSAAELSGLIEESAAGSPLLEVDQEARYARFSRQNYMKVGERASARVSAFFLEACKAR